MTTLGTGVREAADAGNEEFPSGATLPPHETSRAASKRAAMVRFVAGVKARAGNARRGSIGSVKGHPRSRLGRGLLGG